MTKNSINLDSIIPEIPTHINQNQHTGLDSTICSSLAVVIHTSEMCGSFPANPPSLDNSPSQSLTLNLPILYNNNNSLYSILLSASHPQHNDTRNQDPVGHLSPTEDKEISDLWLNEAPTNTIETNLCNEVSTNTIETDLPVIEQENSISINSHDMFERNALDLNEIGIFSVINQENTVQNKQVNYSCAHNNCNPSGLIDWGIKLQNAQCYSATPTEQIFETNCYDVADFVHPLGNLPW